MEYASVLNWGNLNLKHWNVTINWFAFLRWKNLRCSAQLKSLKASNEKEKPGKLFISWKKKLKGVICPFQNPFEKTFTKNVLY